MDSGSRDTAIDSQVAQLLAEIEEIDEVIDETRDKVRAIVSEVYDQLLLGKTLTGIHFVQISDNAYLSVSVLAGRRKAIYGIVHKRELKLLRDKNADSNNNKQHDAIINSTGPLYPSDAPAKGKRIKSARSKKRSNQPNAELLVSGTT